MREWMRDDYLRFDLAFALKKVTVPGFRRAITEDGRMRIAATILEHLRLCRWTSERLPPVEPH